MATWEVANLRCDLAIQFGDDHSRRAYEARCERARASQRCRYAVAPLMSVTTGDGRVLTEGQEVRASDFGLIPARTEKDKADERIKVIVRSRAPEAQLAELVRKGIVLAASWTTGPEAA